MDLGKILPEKGPPINEVSKYIEKYKNDLIVIKYGGNVFIDREIFNNFITDISILNKLGWGCRPFLPLASACPGSELSPSLHPATRPFDRAGGSLCN